MRRSINNSNLIVTLNPKIPISEVYRTLRTNIQFASVERPFQVIMITSSQPGEGKSITVSNLAVTYAQEGKKVLIIDADMRKPSLHQFFSLPNRAGLSSVLNNESSRLEVIKDTIVDNLYLLPSGPIPNTPSELLSSDTMRNLLDQLRNDFDVILIDTPPILAVTDSAIVSVMCDAVVIVAAAGKVKKNRLQKAKEQLDHVNANVIGIVLNQTNRDDQEIFYMKYYG